MTPATLARRLRAIQLRAFNRVLFECEICRIKARLDLENQTVDERINHIIRCPVCGSPRIPLEVAKSLAEHARSVPEWRCIVDAQERFQDDIALMSAMGPHQ
jgi:hypothetical protein